MGKGRQNVASGATVRIWANQKKRLLSVVEARTEKERRPVSEAELVSKAVDMFCDVEEKELGLV